MDTNLKRCIDDLHSAVVEAKLRKQRGEVRPDIWMEDLHPRAATRARTIPLLERERSRLLAELQEVFSVISLTQNHSFFTLVGGRKLKASRGDCVQRSSVRRKREKIGEFVGRAGRSRDTPLELCDFY